MNKDLAQFWTLSSQQILSTLQTSMEGLSSFEVEKRTKQFGKNSLESRKKSNSLTLFLSQFKSPIIIILLFAITIAFFLHDRPDALIILSIVLFSALLSFWQEKTASKAVEKLLELVKVKAKVFRDHHSKEIGLEDIVPGDIVTLSAGSSIPGDCLLLESKDLSLDEAALAGETFPVEKNPAVLNPDTTLAQRTNVLFMGTHVISGEAKAVVVHTAKNTEFGKISSELNIKPKENDFESGIRHFGYFLMQVTLIMLIIIFAVNVYLHKPVLETFLFALALAVGLTPQLLPAIISINLSHGAKRMAQKKVIVKKFNAIENFGSMNILCSDKTGTITEGEIKLQSSLDIHGNESDKTLLMGFLNASFESGFTNPIDKAIIAHKTYDVSTWQKLDEIPYDFIRKRLSVLLKHNHFGLLITKGAFTHMMDICTSVKSNSGKVESMSFDMKNELSRRYVEMSEKGFRVLGIASREMADKQEISKDDENGLTFIGFLTFYDPPKESIKKTIADLYRNKVRLKVITGDNRHVALHVAHLIGLQSPNILTGDEMNKMGYRAFRQKVRTVDIFAEVEPNQKQRIVQALRDSGKVVGFMGYGINDASALHTADVGISVNTAVDVAKETAAIVLMEKDLSVLIEGIREGRVTFANTLKYVFMATSANFGNMFSMAGASLFLPFLPLLPKQILLTNLMTDIPETAIATDSVDKEMIDRPHRWDIKFIQKFMVCFGILSSVFDYATFYILYFVLKSSKEHFRTGWFIESVVSACLIVLVIRSRRFFLKSKPGRMLQGVTFFIIGITILFPYTFLAAPLGFAHLPFNLLCIIGLIILFYIAAAEIVKRMFYKQVSY